MKKPRLAAALSCLSYLSCFSCLAGLPLSAQAGAYEDMETAMIGRNTSAVIDLLRRGMDVNTINPQGDTLLIQAVREDIPELVDALLKRRPRLDFRNRSGETAISIAAYLGKLEYVRKLAEAGARLDFPGWPPLAYAAFNNHPQVVEYLIEKGANINARTETGATPLYLASRYGHTDVVKLLLKHRADPAIPDQHRETALDAAQKAENNEETVKLLHAAGARSGKALEKASGKEQDKAQDGEQGQDLDENKGADETKSPWRREDSAPARGS